MALPWHYEACHPALEGRDQGQLSSLSFGDPNDTSTSHTQARSSHSPGCSESEQSREKPQALVLTSDL